MHLYVFQLFSNFLHIDFIQRETIMVDAAIIGGLLTNLTPLIKDKFSLFWNFKTEVENLSNTLSLLNATLKDVERKNLLEKNNQMEDWLRKLKDVAYEVREIMDDCTFEDLRFQVKKLNASSSSKSQVTNCITHPFRNTRMRLKIGKKIKYVLEKLDQFSSVRTKFQLPETNSDLNPEALTVVGRETMSLLSVNVYGRDEDKKRIVDIVYGRDEDKKRIVEVLVNSSEDDKKLSVLPIIGMGGLGKTTLAQMVFNDENVDKHFDTKFWVCISEEFDINRVMKDIIGDKSEASLDELQKKVRTQLNGKRYLIVLDDVWNEDEDIWDSLRSVLDCGSDGAFVLVTTRKRKVAEIMKTNQHFELSPLSEDACWLLFNERAFRDEISKTPMLFDIGLEIAKKCKGVPLVAKILGAQLGFKSDVKEWCRIRDSDMWKLSQSEEYDILSILRSSYYDLPYYLRRCFVFCAIFPKDTEIEKERLIQLWMAHDLIPINENQEVEDVGNQIWDELCWRYFFQDEKEEINEDTRGVQRTCKMHDLMHDVVQSIMKDDCYSLDDYNLSEDFRREIRRQVMTTNAEYTTVSRGFQSFILHFYYNSRYSKETLSILKDLSSLRVLEVSCGILKSQDLRYVGGLKHLRYLNLSFCDVKTLHNSICDLLNLQTLILDHSYKLESLPRNTKNLINLRHLHLKGCYRLKYMPRGMDRLRYLKKLSLFVIGKDSDGQLDELKELDIRGSMEIKNLEKVNDACIAKGRISMSQKSRINELVLHWNDSRNFHGDDQTKTRDDDDERKIRDEKIGEALEVSSTNLKILSMEGYRGVNIPKWMGESSVSLTILHLSDLDNVEYIFTMKNKNLSDLDNDMDGTVYTLFPLLEELKVSKMKNLREILSPPIPIPIPITAVTFPNLRKIEINYCPNLGVLPPHLKSLRDVTVEGKCMDRLLNSISDLSGLTRLSLTNVKEITTIKLFPLLEKVEICGMENLKELMVSSPITTTTHLCKIVINRCPKLGALPPHLTSLEDVTVKGQCTDELLYSLSKLSGLTHLTLMFMEERSVLFKGVDYYKADDDDDDKISSSFQSLRHLEIQFCFKLRCLFDKKLASGCYLRNLNSVTIIGCRNLMISLEELRNLDRSNSLESLKIINCPKLLSSKVEETEEVIALLRSLHKRLGSKNFREDIRQGRRCRNCTPMIPLKKDPVEILNEEDIGEEQST